VTTGARNAAIDVAAARARGVVVCGTEGLPYPTAELTWALILALARHVPAEDRATRAGKRGSGKRAWASACAARRSACSASAVSVVR
jgi:lactate dehydrogenase-like 2-hydroxyacid dehydrogenase